MGLTPDKASLTASHHIVNEAASGDLKTRSCFGSRSVRMRAVSLPRPFLVGAAVALLLVGSYGSMGPARLTALNAGLRVDYPWRLAASACLASAAAVALVIGVRRLWVRLALGVLAVLGLYATLHLALFRFEAGDPGVVLRDVFGSQRLAWSDVARIESGPGLRVLVTLDNRRVALDTTDLPGADLAALDRTMARRLRDARSTR